MVLNHDKSYEQKKKSILESLFFLAQKPGSKIEYETVNPTEQSLPPHLSLLSFEG